MLRHVALCASLVCPLSALGVETVRILMDEREGSIVLAGDRLSVGEDSEGTTFLPLERKSVTVRRNARGRLPAPPHDESGHTWHHDDVVLFEVTKYGLAKHAPAGYQSDMPAFGDRLSDDEIVAVLAYIKSRWPQDIHRKRKAAGMT